jgi:hypothetical protein
VIFVSAPLADTRRPHRPPDSTRLALAVAFLALAALLAILPVAGANLSDPLWVAGIYDGGDYDDVVALAADGGSPAPFGQAAPGPTLASAHAVPSAATAYVKPHLRALPPRAPPLA